MTHSIVIISLCGYYAAANHQLLYTGDSMMSLYTGTCMDNCATHTFQEYQCVLMCERWGKRESGREGGREGREVGERYIKLDSAQGGQAVM